jgi:hypothetical protein
MDDGIEVGDHFGAGPILGADDFAINAAIGIDDVSFGIHGGAVVEGDLLGGVAVVGEGDLVGFEEILVGGLVVVNADAEDGGAERGDAALEGVEGGGFIHAGRAPSGPEIEDHDMAAQVREAGRLAVEGELKIGGRAAADAGLALAVIGVSEEEEKSCEECEDEACFQFPFQSGIQGIYNTLFVADGMQAVLRPACGVKSQNLGIRDNSRPK